jgi:hypothetical protein
MAAISFDASVVSGETALRQTENRGLIAFRETFRYESYARIYRPDQAVRTHVVKPNIFVVED